MDRTLYHFEIGDLVAHRLHPHLKGVVVEYKIIPRNGRGFVYISWFENGPNQTFKYPQAHIVRISDVSNR